MSDHRHSGAGRNPANTIMLGALFSLAALTWNESAQAAPLGRLFYTPQQRQQMDYQIAGGGSEEEANRNYIVVNGVVQKQGGNRTVWINGTAQEPERSGTKSPATVSVTVPTTNQTVTIKVGQKLILDGNSAKVPSSPADED